MNVFAGCSGFHYKHWKGSFYPDDMPEEEWLSYYTRHFQTVEINRSFYSLPKEKDLKNWYEQTPAHFRFTMKGSRYITHMKKLVPDKDLSTGLTHFYKSAEILEGKLGCVLWQLPGNLHRDDDKLERFCSMLSPGFKNVIEFRHDSWFTDAVFDILAHNEVSYCIISAPDNLPELVRSTTDTGYIRFHGKKDWYHYFYSEQEIDDWCQKLKGLNVRRMWIYFNNDAEAWAPKNALRMLQKLQDIK